MDDVPVLVVENGYIVLHGRTCIQYQLGKEDCQRIRQARPQASAIAIIDELIRSELVSGVGTAKVSLPESGTEPIYMELSDPCVKTTRGAGRSFEFAYWAGALAQLFGRELDFKDVTYDPESNVKKCRLVPREKT